MPTRRPNPAESPRAPSHAYAVPPEAARWSRGPTLPHPVGLRRQAVPPLRPAPAQDLPPIRRAHALEEAVTAFSFALVRLIRPFHRSSMPIGKVVIILPSPVTCQGGGASVIAPWPWSERWAALGCLGWGVLYSSSPHAIWGCGREIRDDGWVEGLLTNFLHKSGCNYWILLLGITYPHMWKSLCVTRLSSAFRLSRPVGRLSSRNRP